MCLWIVQIVFEMCLKAREYTNMNFLSFVKEFFWEKYFRNKKW